MVTTDHRSEDLIDHVLSELADAQPDDDIVVMTAHRMRGPGPFHHRGPFLVADRSTCRSKWIDVGHTGSVGGRSIR